MDKKTRDHLRKIILMDFNKYLKLKMVGYCQVNYNIAVYNQLGENLVKDMKERYFNVFGMNLLYNN